MKFKSVYFQSRWSNQDTNFKKECTLCVDVDMYRIRKWIPTCEMLLCIRKKLQRIVFVLKASNKGCVPIRVCIIPSAYSKAAFTPNAITSSFSARRREEVDVPLLEFCCCGFTLKATNAHRCEKPSRFFRHLPWFRPLPSLLSTCERGVKMLIVRQSQFTRSRKKTKLIDKTTASTCKQDN